MLTSRARNSVRTLQCGVTLRERNSDIGQAFTGTSKLLLTLVFLTDFASTFSGLQMRANRKPFALRAPRHRNSTSILHESGKDKK